MAAPSATPKKFKIPNDVWNWGKENNACVGFACGKCNKSDCKYDFVKKKELTRKTPIEPEVHAKFTARGAAS